MRVFLKEGGPFVEVDTVAQAREILGLVESNGVKAKVSHKAKVNANGHVVLTDRARKFLEALLNHQRGVKGDALATELKENAAAFGGLMRSVSAVADCHKIPLSDVMLSEMRFHGKDRYRWFEPKARLADLLKD